MRLSKARPTLVARLGGVSQAKGGIKRLARWGSPSRGWHEEASFRRLDKGVSRARLRSAKEVHWPGWSSTKEQKTWLATKDGQAGQVVLPGWLFGPPPPEIWFLSLRFF